MKIAALVHYYVPFRNAGSETMLHTLLRQLNEHEVRVFATDILDAPDEYTYDNVTIQRCDVTTAKGLLIAYEPDIVITHHHNAPLAIRVGRYVGAKSVFLMHNDHTANRNILRARPDLIVFNTDWIANVTEHRGKTIVIHPPVIAADHATTPGDRVTLVNLNEHKGSGVLYALAERMPDVKFLGVVGGHGKQIVRTDLPNVEIVQHTDDMPGDVWSRTRILLMPSIYESYGLAGVEAMASGIPVIANPTPGLIESLGPAGVFVDRDDVPEWEAAIRRLLEPANYLVASRLATKRSIELNPADEMCRWVETIEGLK